MSAVAMDPSKFAALAAAGYNRIPVTHRVLADLETPLSAYLKLAAGPHSFLFESVQGGEKWGRYSIIGLPAREILSVSGRQVILRRDGEIIEQLESDDPLGFVSEFLQRFRVPELAGAAGFMGGLVGYFAYDCVSYVEPRLAANTLPDRLQMPDIVLMVVDNMLVFDNLRGTIDLISLADPDEPDALANAEASLAALEARLAEPAQALPALDLQAGTGDDDGISFTSECGREHYQLAVERIREYILAGDVMQVVPSHRLTAPFAGRPINLYRSLRHLNPSPYLYFLDFEDFQVAGSSPEILVRLTDEEVTVRPMAGTRHRGADEAEDLALERELLADPKELAEHLMLIDLGRNDVRRVASTGSVELTEQMVIERYSHVMHIVSNVNGSLQPGLDAIDVLRATLPAGTLSGAPKIRAMEIIDELEPTRRGVYGGAVGYLAWDGDMDTAIAIRTAVIKDGELTVQAGAGIVADSVPELEWQETLNKARVMFLAAAMASSTEEKPI
jgi:anthranilate synthase component 1